MISEKVIFKQATIDELEGIIKLCNECFEENTSMEYATEIYKENMNDKNQIYLVGLLDSEIIAHVKITIIPTIYENMNTYAILNHVCVKPELRRHNIATKMLDEVTKICKENKCKKMELWSMNFRQPAHSCYKNYGFDVDDAKFFSKEI